MPLRTLLRYAAVAYIVGRSTSADLRVVHRGIHPSRLRKAERCEKRQQEDGRSITWPSSSARSIASWSTIRPRDVLRSTLPRCRVLISFSPIIPVVVWLRGTCRLSMSACLHSSSTLETYSHQSGTDSAFLREKYMMRIGKACARWANLRPMPPKPKIPSVRPVTSWVCAALYGIFHVPERSERSAMEKCRRHDSMRYRVAVAVASSFAPGVFDTSIPGVITYINNSWFWLRVDITSLFAGLHVDFIVTTATLSDPADFARIG